MSEHPMKKRARMAVGKHCHLEDLALQARTKADAAEIAMKHAVEALLRDQPEEIHEGWVMHWAIHFRIREDLWQPLVTAETAA